MEGDAPKCAEEGPPAVYAEDRATVSRPLLDQGEGLRVEPDGPVARLAARDPEGSSRGVEVGRPQRQGLSYPEPRAPEDYEERAVAKPGG